MTSPIVQQIFTGWPDVMAFGDEPATDPPSITALPEARRPWARNAANEGRAAVVARIAETEGVGPAREALQSIALNEGHAAYALVVSLLLQPAQAHSIAS